MALEIWQYAFLLGLIAAYLALGERFQFSADLRAGRAGLQPATKFCFLVSETSGHH